MANGCALLLLFIGLGGSPLLDQPGSRYPEVAREMMERGDFITPTQNYVPFFHKPPLLYWMLAGSMGVFGETEWAVRLVPAACGALGMLVAYWLAALCIGREAARYAPAILATTMVYFVNVRVAQTDIVMSLALAAALTAWWSAQRAAEGRYWRLVASGLLLGAAILSKGPVAVVLFVGVVGVYLVWAWKPRAVLAGLGIPCIVAGVLAAPWFVAVSLRDPEFAHYYFVFQHLQRFTGQGFVEHPRHWWFFLPFVTLGLGVWCFFWPSALVGWLKRWRALTPDALGAAKFLTAWTAVVFLFFSASTCKLIPYVLPLFWPMAVGSAAGLRRVLSAERPPIGVRLAAWLPALVPVGAAAFFVWWMGRQGEAPDAVFRPAATLTVICLVAAAAGLLVSLRPRSVDARFIVLAGSAALMLASAIPTYTAIMSNHAMGGVVPKALVESIAEEPWTVAQYQAYNASLCFYAHTRVVLIDFVGQEMSMGPEQPDGAYWFREGDDAIDDLSAGGPLALYVEADAPAGLAERHGLTAWVENDERALLVNYAGAKLLRTAGARVVERPPIIVGPPPAATAGPSPKPPGMGLARGGPRRSYR